MPRTHKKREIGYTIIQYGFILFSASNGVVLATEKKQKSILYDEQSVHKVEPITKHIGMVYSGMGPDYRFVFYLFTEINRTLVLFHIFKPKNNMWRLVGKSLNQMNVFRILHVIVLDSLRLPVQVLPLQIYDTSTKILKGTLKACCSLKLSNWLNGISCALNLVLFH